MEYPADAHTVSFIPEAKTNVWTVERYSGRTFVYAPRRKGTDRGLRLEFDVTTSITARPPWGNKER